MKKSMPSYLDDAVLRSLCAKRQWVRPLREVVARWRSTKFEDENYPVVRMLLSSWANALGISTRTARRHFSDMARAGLIHTRKVGSSNGTNIAVVPSLEVQLACRGFLAAKGRIPREVPLALIAGTNSYRLSSSRRNYKALQKRQFEVMLGALDHVVGGDFYKVSGPVLHTLPKGTEKKSKVEATGQNGQLLGSKLAGSSITQKGTTYPSSYDAPNDASSSSTPGKPGVESAPSGKEKGSVSREASPAPKWKLVPKPTLESCLNSSPKSGAVFCAGAKINGHKTAAPDILSNIKPVLNDTASQKGLPKTWSETMIAAGHKPLMLGAAETKMLKTALTLIKPEERLQALAFVIQHWSKFRSWVSDSFAVYEKTIPEMPTPQKLIYHRSFFEMFWREREAIVGKVVAKAQSEKKQFQTMADALAALEIEKAGGQ